MEILPTIQHLYSDEVTKQQDVFVSLMNQNPKPEWVKEHPFIKGYKYLPIERIEFLMKSIFKAYKIEITGQGTAFNGVWVTVRLHYMHPIFQEWYYHDGIGACQLQTAKGTSPADLANINNGALSMAFPIAKTVAIKDACDHFGKLFGSDLNRKDDVVYADPQTLVPFERGHEKWWKAVESIAKRLVTIDQTAKKYNLTDQGKAQLQEDVEQFKINNNI